MQVRPYQPQDIALITDSWIREIPATRQGEYLRGHVVKHFHPPLIKRALVSGTCLVACDNEDPTVVFGYVVGKYAADGDVIHFLYVKKAFRKMGIAAELMKRFKRKDKACFTHYTRAVKVKRKGSQMFGYEDLYYNPYLFFEAV
jgi:GNAT superfamily N-acetyltransferase